MKFTHKPGVRPRQPSPSGGFSKGRARSHLVGVIADTHGLMRPQALAALVGVDRIIHAGDIGAAEVLRAL